MRPRSGCRILAHSDNFERQDRAKPRERQRDELEALWKEKRRCRRTRNGPLLPVIEDEGAGTEGATGINGITGELTIWAPRGFAGYRHDGRDRQTLHIAASLISSCLAEGASLREAVEYTVAELGIAGPTFDKTVEDLRKRYSRSLKGLSFLD